jgi:hypothetical protein
MSFDSVYKAYGSALRRSADDLPSFWRLLGDGSNEIVDARRVFMEHREVLNQLGSLGIHLGETDLCAALALTYKLNSATQQLCIVFRDAIVAPVLWEAKCRCEELGDAEGPALRMAFLNVCSEIFGPAFIGSVHADMMLLAADKRFQKVALEGARIGQQPMRPWESMNSIRSTSHKGNRHTRHRPAGTGA